MEAVPLQPVPPASRARADSLGPASAADHSCWAKAAQEPNVAPDQYSPKAKTPPAWRQRLGNLGWGGAEAPADGEVRSGWVRQSGRGTETILVEHSRAASSSICNTGSKFQRYEHSPGSTWPNGFCKGPGRRARNFFIRFYPRPADPECLCLCRAEKCHKCAAGVLRRVYVCPGAQ